jgi:hypothetical protein
MVVWPKHVEIVAYVEGVWEQGAEVDIWTKEGWSEGRVVKTA